MSLYHDVMARYEFESGTAVSLGVTNLTNEEPPFIEVGFNATTDPSPYRMLGRGVWLPLQQTFKMWHKHVMANPGESRDLFSYCGQLNRQPETAFCPLLILAHVHWLLGAPHSAAP
jgi:hypothetical protein